MILAISENVTAEVKVGIFPADIAHLQTPCAQSLCCDMNSKTHNLVTKI
jgi:hypothetical protein